MTLIGVADAFVEVRRRPEEQLEIGQIKLRAAADVDRDPPTVSVNGMLSERGLSSAQARELAAVLTDGADEIDQWVAETARRASATRTLGADTFSPTATADLLPKFGLARRRWRRWGGCGGAGRWVLMDGGEAGQTSSTGHGAWSTM